MNDGVSIVVRFATKDDLKALLVFDRGTRLDVLESKIDLFEIMVAERLGEVIGYLKLEYIWSKLPYISLIIMKSEFRGRGIGTLMLNYLTDFLKMNGFEILLSSSQVDEVAPQHWHRKRGFSECGILSGINEGGVGEVFFKLILD